MTNGEMIQKVFNCEVCEPIIEDDIIHVIFADKKDSAIGFDWSWWNAEYKEPTTRNCFGCKYSKDNHNSGTEECHLCMWENQYAPTTKNDLPSGLEKNSKKLEKDFGKSDCISRAQTQTEIEMNASRYTIAKERGGMGQVEWSDQLIKVSDAVDIIRHLPPVTPQEPRKGHWIYDYTSADGHRTYHCSECGCYLQPKHSEPLNSFKWCSLCGADMREVEA